MVLEPKLQCSLNYTFFSITPVIDVIPDHLILPLILLGLLIVLVDRDGTWKPAKFVKRHCSEGGSLWDKSHPSKVGGPPDWLVEV